MGVWIETEIGLNYAQAKNVTPFVGVWIETSLLPYVQAYPDSHTLRGCVD